MRLTFSVVAPSLGGYRYRLFDVTHGIDGYPATILYFDDRFECPDRASFESYLQDLFRDERTMRAIQQLLALVSA